MAAAKIGMIVAEIDPAIETIAEIRSALAASECKALYFKPETETQNNLLLLRKAIPELYYCKS